MLYTGIFKEESGKKNIDDLSEQKREKEERLKLLILYVKIDFVETVGSVVKCLCSSILSCFG